MVELSKSQARDLACSVVADIAGYISSHQAEFERFLLEEAQHEQ